MVAHRENVHYPGRHYSDVAAQWPGTRGRGMERRLVELPLKAVAGGPSIEPGEFFLFTPDVYKNVRNGEPVYAEYVGSSVQNSRYGKTVRLIQ